eukprot:gene3176-1870_t
MEQKERETVARSMSATLGRSKSDTSVMCGGFLTRVCMMTPAEKRSATVQLRELQVT